MPESYIGLISGTSIDAIDCVLAEFGQGHVQLRAQIEFPIDDSIKTRLNVLIRQGASAGLDDVCRLDVQMGHLFARAAQHLVDESGINASDVRAIGSHGQTIYHLPDANTATSIQIGDPNIIAEQTGITTVADFRRRDIAASGQGAPLVPAFHRAVFQSAQENRVILNIGGIANLTVLPSDPNKAITGFDSGPGNTLLDQWSLQHRGQSMDKNAAFAQSGQSDPALLQLLLSDPYFARPIPKSTGREYFNLDWLQSSLQDMQLKPEQVQATLCELTATSILDALRAHAPDTRSLIVCGGGVHNPRLMELLAHNDMSVDVASSADYGIDPDYVEGMAFAWLAYQTLHNKNGNIKSVTGARAERILGGIYPGEHGL